MEGKQTLEELEAEMKRLRDELERIDREFPEFALQAG